MKKLLIIFFWLAVWQAAAWLTGNSILLAGPAEVLKVFTWLPFESAFWKSVGLSFFKISTGFLAGFTLGILFGWIARIKPLFGELFAPVIMTIKSIPVASFVILALIWMGSKNLSAFISFLVVLPIIYESTIAGLANADHKMLEMCKVYEFNAWQKFRWLYWPALFPSLLGSCKSALGMSWKSGVAAEVIGVPANTIGEGLYLSKIYLNTAELFAWTLVIVLVSTAFEKLFLAVFSRSNQAKVSAFYQKREGRKALALPEQPLQLTGIKKSYGSLTVLDGLELTFWPRANYCIMGPSGSGKTTLLHLLLGLEQPDHGSITGQPAHFSCVFQEDRLFEQLSPVDNLLLTTPGLTRSQIKTQLSALLPAESLTRPVSSLSGGMKRRVAIGRALLAPSQAIIMDEPFTGLDEKTKKAVIQFIKGTKKDRLLIISTHQPEDVQLLGAKRYVI